MLSAQELNVSNNLLPSNVLKSTNLLKANLNYKTISNQSNKLNKQSLSPETLSPEIKQIKNALQLQIKNFLTHFISPTYLLLFLSLATTGLILEIWSPGAFFPGAIGLVSLIIAIYSLQIIPTNLFFLAIILIGAILILFESFSPLLGISGALGILFFSIGSFFLFPNELRLSLPTLALLLSPFFFILIFSVLAFKSSHKAKTTTGFAQIKNSKVEIIEWDKQNKKGIVKINGELWAAYSENDPTKQEQTVDKIDGLTLILK